ncbi:hypothetical protein ANAPC5_01060 [Anaplasma phagocytophilum]|nr:hypothetical protein ANAPC2_00835 [Anaplasma phagocytophilum]SBO32078.1 hypothetical protein ANAPC3_00741 [Anaplasma phagocytophilum]SBO32378.1 hypothetical protein ANAPC4_00789 [Anaplasma phagocytophilum]SCV65127.1 hypothetical protein ANAPC5_01060 [Anaplasma phagocytophilum]
MPSGNARSTPSTRCMPSSVRVCGPPARGSDSLVPDIRSTTEPSSACGTTPWYAAEAPLTSSRSSTPRLFRALSLNLSKSTPPPDITKSCNSGISEELARDNRRISPFILSMSLCIRSLASSSLVCPRITSSPCIASTASQKLPR